MSVITTIWSYIVSHQLIFYYLFAVAIDQLPMPTSTSSGFYKWFFGVMQVSAANWIRGRLGTKGGPNGSGAPMRVIPVLVLFLIVPLLSGCPKDPYRASIQGSSDVSQAVSSAIKITASYYSAGTINDAKKAQVAGVLDVVTNCNMTFRKAVVDVHNAGQTGVAAFLPIADSFVHCAQLSPQVKSDVTMSNILKAVDTAVNGVEVAVASAKGAK